MDRRSGTVLLQLHRQGILKDHRHRWQCSHTCRGGWVEKGGWITAGCIEEILDRSCVDGPATVRYDRLGRDSMIYGF